MNKKQECQHEISFGTGEIETCLLCDKILSDSTNCICLKCQKPYMKCKCEEPDFSDSEIF